MAAQVFHSLSKAERSWQLYTEEQDTSGDIRGEIFLIYLFFNASECAKNRHIPSPWICLPVCFCWFVLVCLVWHHKRVQSSWLLTSDWIWVMMKLLKSLNQSFCELNTSSFLELVVKVKNPILKLSVESCRTEWPLTDKCNTKWTISFHLLKN